MSGDRIEQSMLGGAAFNRQAAPLQFEAEQATVVVRPLVGKAADKIGASLDAVNIGPLGPGREVAQGHAVEVEAVVFAPYSLLHGYVPVGGRSLCCRGSADAKG